ncbi:protein LURP-one-related 11 [Zea mays]|uniref:Protein LURP-one-related 2 n=1 Tax=Zea mays TaxID=4577 RepID=A0A1D6N2A4_MAIZE|nr:protein LURP-one-related 11 [Zea mays]ONM34846.1 Protein LURP-one-related 2 [Zea mays]|eukprot:XP_008676148.1 protein LURP-one-related 11 [Zea mays]
MAITRIQPLSAHLHPRAVAATPAAGKQQQQAVYTVWMKSLVLGGHGCTVYGDDGRVAYRVDNYACSRSREAYVMDGDGRTLLKLLKKHFAAFATWKGYSYRTADSDPAGAAAGVEQEESPRPWFSVRKARRVLKQKGRQRGGGAVATVCVGGEVYRIDGVPRKSEYRIRGPGGEVVAETRRKQTGSGVALGEDVLSLTVGPAAHAERLLLVGLVVVCGLIGHSI